LTFSSEMSDERPSITKVILGPEDGAGQHVIDVFLEGGDVFTHTGSAADAEAIAADAGLTALPGHEGDTIRSWIRD